MGNHPEYLVVSSNGILVKVVFRKFELFLSRRFRSHRPVHELNEISAELYRGKTEFSSERTVDS